MYSEYLFQFKCNFAGSGANFGRVSRIGIMAGMTAPALDLFKGRHFERDVIVLSVRRCLRGFTYLGSYSRTMRFFEHCNTQTHRSKRVCTRTKPEV
jgi:hypothetical protein